MMPNRSNTLSTSRESSIVNNEFASNEEKPGDCQLPVAQTQQAASNSKLPVVPKTEDQLMNLPENDQYQDSEYEYNYDEIDEEPSETEPTNEGAEDGTATTVRTRKFQDAFTHEEALHMFKFLLGVIASRTEGRVGRVAKRRVDLSTLDIWTKYKLMYDLHRPPAAYRTNYRLNVIRLHNFRGLTLEEKADLWYALDVKVAKVFRLKLAKLFGCEFSEDGIIMRSSSLTHWDLVHPESDREDEILMSVQRNKQWNRFTELDDGIMWEFVVDYIQTADCIQINGMKAWTDFKQKYRMRGINMKRSAETYRGRYNRILVPNLHKMPFDICTKAAIYDTFKYVVPVEFRQTLINETGVKIDRSGRVYEYKNRPKKFVLQSRPYKDLIGIRSPHITSSLRYPQRGIQDTVPYTDEENEKIWRFINISVRDPTGKPIRCSKKVTGWLFWKEFMKQTRSNRTWQSLSNHFTTNLMDNLLDTNFDIQTKIELYFSLQIPVEENIIHQFQKMTTALLLKDNRKIRYALGKNENGQSFEVGRRKILPWPTTAPELLVPRVQTLNVKPESDLSTDDEEDQYDKAGFNELPNGWDEPQYQYKPEPVKKDRTHSIKVWPTLRNENGRFMSRTPFVLTPSASKPVLPKVSASIASKPALAPTPIPVASGGSNSVMYPYMASRKSVRPPPPPKKTKTIKASHKTLPPVTILPPRDSRLEPQNVTVVDTAEVVNTAPVPLREVKSESVEKTSDVITDDFLHREIKQEIDEEASVVDQATLTSAAPNGDDFLLREPKLEPSDLDFLGFPKPKETKPENGIFGNPDSSGQNNLNKGDVQIPKITIAERQNEARLAGARMALKEALEASRKREIDGEVEKYLIAERQNKARLAGARMARKEALEASRKRKLNEEKNKHSIRSCGVRELIPTSSAAPTTFEDPNVPIQAAFNDMEKHIKNFCNRLKKEHSRITNEDTLSYTCRITQLARIFKANTKDALYRHRQQKK